MKESINSRYAFNTDSQVSLLSDGSGLAIYDGYSCNTHFIHSKKDQDNFSSLLNAPSELTVEFLVDNFGLTQRAACHTIEQLVKQKVLWEIA